MGGTPIVSYHYSPDRGVYGVIIAGQPPETANPMPQPSALRTLYDTSVQLYDCGCAAGMADARRHRHDRRAYEAHKTLVAGQRKTAISRAYSEGYVAGFAAITSGAMQ